ncbi:hypothetical protein K438DRAFT_1987419 [Mycena galopus ATCC 62051]|nr:hypothetical protein K438DRAFT_1987419 [Mycena galopus ATCC 62051]
MEILSGGKFPNALSTEAQANLRDIPDSFNDGGSYNDDVLQGRVPADISHPGDGLVPNDGVHEDTELLESLRVNQRRRYVDPRTRRERAQLLFDAFTAQLEATADTFVMWSLAIAEAGLGGAYQPPEDMVLQETREVLVVDMFGWMPMAPYFPTVVITTRALEVYRVAHLRCPRLGIQVFMCALCDIHGVAPRLWLGTQFSVVFDLYLAIHARADKHMELEDEPHLEIPLMATFDGNSSLSRFDTREKTHVDEDGTATAEASREQKDNCAAPGAYYLLREEVNKWARDGLSDLMRGFVPESSDNGEDEDCTEGWQNMKEEVTARTYEMGFFPTLCLSITAHVITVLGEIAIGHDIGCKFAKLVKAHPLLSKLAADNHFRALVGAFHGHGHKCRCAVENLMTYMKGVGTEALEGQFHRQQAITTYLKHTDTFDTYQGLWLLRSKYRRALETKTTHGALLALLTAMRELSVESRDEFVTWLGKEKAYLWTLSKEPTKETQDMEYYQKLVNLRDIDERNVVIFKAAKAKQQIEMQRHHALEVQDRALAVVQDLEVHLGIDTRWVAGDEKWEGVSAMVTKRRCQRTLHHLVGLIVARIFELAKCGMAGMGYKLRKHIAKVIQARSKAVQAAIECYNIAASAMMLQKPALEWDDIVKYVFLVDFDFLRDVREDIRGEMILQFLTGVIRHSPDVYLDELWELFGAMLFAGGAGPLVVEIWAAEDLTEKLLHANEELLWLNVEIHCLVTYMGDEEAFLLREEGCLREEGKEGLAHQVGLVRMESPASPATSPGSATHAMGAPDGDEDTQDIEEAGSDGDGEGDNNEDEILAMAFLNVLRIAIDSAPNMNNE